LKLKYDEPLSNFAFSFNLRHYTMACGNEGVVQEAEAFLSETQDQSNVDQDAFL